MFRRFAASFAAFILLAAVVVAAPGTAGGQEVAGQADSFARLDDPASAAYTPAPEYQHNDGGPVTVAKLGTGVWEVTFPAVVGPTYPRSQVSAFQGPNGSYCNEVYGRDQFGGAWNSGDDFVATVECFNDGGNPTDVKASILVVHTTDDAYGHADATGVMINQFNPYGAAATVAQTATGAYTVTVPGAPTGLTNVQVTASWEAPSRNAYCAALQVSPSSFDVRCYDPAGTAIDSNFNWFAPRTFDDAYATVTAAGAFDFPGTYNPGGFTPSLTKLNTGYFKVVFPGMTSDTLGNVVAVASDGSSGRCHVADWFSVEAYVVCYAANGIPADVGFTLTWTRWLVCNGQIATSEIANGSLQPTAGDDVIVGTDGDDAIDGLGGDDVICALGGDDEVFGGPGDDLILGGPGADVLSGDDGFDFLLGGGDDDEMSGGLGDDLLFGGSGNDIMLGNAGNDELLGGDDNDILAGNAGVDLLDGEAGDDQAFGGSGDDLVFGGLGDDNVIGGGSGNDLVEGQEGNDRLNGGGGDDVVRGGIGADTVVGGGDDDFVEGGDGDDRISGNGGEDELRGGDGNDQLFGGNKDDRLFGEGGDDFLGGNDGTDRCDGGTTDETAGDVAASNCELIINVP